MSSIAPSCRSPAARFDSHLTRSSPSVRDYLLEDDDGDMCQAMSHIADEEEAIRMHHEALQAIEDAALARALALSEETALREATRRVRHSEPHISSTESLPEKTDPSATYSFISHATASAAKGRARSESNQAATRANIASMAISPMDDGHSSLQVSNATSSNDTNVLSAHASDRAKVYSRGKIPHKAYSPQPAEQSGPSSQSNVIDDCKSLAQNGFSATNDGPDFSQELFSNVKFFAPPRKCCYCDQYVERVHNSETVKGLHAVCIICRTIYCRGCFRLARCSPDCIGGTSCLVENCCPGIRAIAAFDTLSDFCNAFAMALRTHQDGNYSHDYIKTFMHRKDASIRRFEHTFINTLRTLPRHLRPLGAELHPPMAHIVATSCLPQVIHDYLEHEDVRDWMLHNNTYQAILDALKELPACGLSTIFSEPFACDKKRGEPVPAGTNQVTENVRCLKDAVRHLDGHYKQFMAMSSRITFPATLLKMHKLSDGILYLLLQQVVN